MRLRGLLVGLALAATSLAVGALALDRLFPPDLSRYNDRSTEVVDSSGRLLRAFTTGDGKWRLKTTVDDVDPVYLALLKAYEDRRFDDHWGVDPLAAVRAAEQWITRGRIVSGASTLSMQAARLLEPDLFRIGPRRTLGTKLLQSARALQLEWRYSKREVLGIYLTLAPMGGNLEGVRAASFAYFGKEPKHLNAAEAALLVAIPQSPERRRPDRSPAAAQAARERVLARGLQHEVIDASLRDLASSRPVPNRRLAMPLHAPHLSAWLAGQSPGAVVPTTIRFELQSALLQLAREERGRIADRPDIAIVAVDNRTGTVVAWQGGSDYFGRAGQVDLVRAHRSPGSALKPLIYAMAFDDRTLHPESLIEDVPVRFRDWLPRNFDRDHQGAVTVRRALQQSLNVPAVLTLEKVGPQRFLSTLRTAGAVPGLPPGDTGASLGIALGSATVSPLEMAGLYAGLARGGEFAPPVIRRDRAGRDPVRLIGPAAVWYVGDVLADAPLPDGFANLPVNLRERRVAYKTGTSAGFRDAWAAGYTHQLDGRRVGRPCRRHVAAGPARPPRRAPHPVQGLQPPAGRGQHRQAAAGRRPARRLVARPAGAHALAGADRRAGQPAHCLPAGRRPHRARAERGRAAHRQGRQGQPALADRRPADRRHEVGARRAGRGPRRGGRRGRAIPAPSPCASSSDVLDERRAPPRRPAARRRRR